MVLDLGDSRAHQAAPGRPGAGLLYERVVAYVEELIEPKFKLDKDGLLPNAELAGSVQLWEWIGDEGATTFSY